MTPEATMTGSGGSKKKEVEVIYKPGHPRIDTHYFDHALAMLSPRHSKDQIVIKPQPLSAIARTRGAIIQPLIANSHYKSVMHAVAKKDMFPWMLVSVRAGTRRPLRHWRAGVALPQRSFFKCLRGASNVDDQIRAGDLGKSVCLALASWRLRMLADPLAGTP